VQGGYDTAAPSSKSGPRRSPRIAETLLEREILDGDEVMQIIKGQTLAPFALPGGGKDAEEHVQQVLRPEGGRRGSRALGRGAPPARVIPPFRSYLFDVDRHVAGFRPPTSWAPSNRQSPAQGAQPRWILRFLEGLRRPPPGRTPSATFPGYGPSQIDELIRQYRTFYLARGHKMTRVYPGVAEALAALPRPQIHGHHQGHSHHSRRA